MIRRRVGIGEEGDVASPWSWCSGANGASQNLFSRSAYHLYSHFHPNLTPTHPPYIPPSALTPIGILTGPLLFIPPYFHQRIPPNSSTIILNQTISNHNLHPIRICLSPCSHASHTSRNLFGSSVITPSAPLDILHFIKDSSLTVHINIGRPRAFASRRNLEPMMGPMRVFWKRLKEMLGVCKNWRA